MRRPSTPFITNGRQFTFFKLFSGAQFHSFVALDQPSAGGGNYFNQVFADNNHNFQPGFGGLNVSPDMHLLGASELQIHGFDGVGITILTVATILLPITDNASYVQGAHQLPLRRGDPLRQRKRVLPPAGTRQIYV